MNESLPSRLGSGLHRLLGHKVLGILLVAIVLVFALQHLPRVWNRRGIETLGTGLLTVAICTVLLLTGLFILTEAASRSHRWIWWVHVVAAGLSPVVYVLHRRASVVRSLPARSPTGGLSFTGRSQGVRRPLMA